MAAEATQAKPCTDESRPGGQRRCRIPLMFPRILVVMGSQRT